MSAAANTARGRPDRSPWARERPGPRSETVSSPRVLVVDENIAPLITLVYLLNNHGWPARGSGSLGEALDLLRHDHGSFRALVASAAVAERLARVVRSEFPDLPVIAVADAADVEGQQKTDCFAYLERPFRLEQLLGAVREAAQQTPAERRNA